jgi:hypothetical protein
LCLDNLPKGRFERSVHFERSVIGTDDARTMIRDARSDKKLLCVSEDDLLAPGIAAHRRPLTM